MGHKSDEESIWEAIGEANRAWVSGDPLEVGALFARDAVMVLPGLAGALVGRDAIVQSFVDYTQTAKTTRFDELEHQIHVFGDTAGVVYRFRVAYELDGASYEETGQEILVLQRKKKGWRVVMRTQAPVLEAQATA